MNDLQSGGTKGTKATIGNTLWRQGLKSYSATAKQLLFMSSFELQPGIIHFPWPVLRHIATLYTLSPTWKLWEEADDEGQASGIFILPYFF